MNDIKSGELMQISQALDFIQSKVKSALQYRSKLVSMNYANDIDEAKCDSVYSPDLYYHFKYLDFELAITVNKSFIDPSTTYFRKYGSNLVYHICFRGSFDFIRSYCVKHGYPVTRDLYFGNFDSLDVAIKVFQITICQYLVYQNPMLMPMQSDLFDVSYESSMLDGIF